MVFQPGCRTLLFWFRPTIGIRDSTNQEWLTHFESISVDIMYHKPEIFVNAALINELKIFVTNV